MQVLVQKVGEVARIQHTQHIEHDKRQQEFAQAIARQTEHNTKEVNHMLKSEHAEIHQRQEKQKKEKKSQEKKGKTENEANNDNKSLNPDNSGHLLDITI